MGVGVRAKEEEISELGKSKTEKKIRRRRRQAYMAGRGQEANGRANGGDGVERREGGG
jgi:hypothetical protein